MTSAASKDERRVNFIRSLYGEQMGYRIKEMLDATDDDDVPGFATSVRRSIDREMGIHSLTAGAKP